MLLCKSFLLYLLILSVYFLPTFKLFPIKLSVLISFSLLCYFAINIIYRYKFKKEYIDKLYLYALFFISGFCFTIINGNDYFLIIKIYLFPIITAVLIFTTFNKALEGVNVNDIIKFLLYCYFTDAVFKIIEILYPSLKDFWLSVIVLDQQWLGSLGTRNLGLSGISIYNMACIGILLVYIDYILNKKIRYIVYPICILSAIISGRTSFFLIVLFFSMFPFKTFKLNIYLLSIVIILGFICYSLVPGLDIKWLLEPITNVLNGNFTTESTNDLIENNLYIPDNIFGYGVWGQYGLNNTSIRSSDSGYILTIIYSGWFGLVFLCAFVLQILKNTHNLKLKICIILSILFVMIKGPIIFDPIIILILVSFMFYTNKKKAILGI